MQFLKRIRILPLLVIVASLSFMVRFGELVSGIRDNGIAFAQQEVHANPPPLPAKPEVGAKKAQDPASAPSSAQDATHDGGADKTAMGDAAHNDTQADKTDAAEGDLKRPGILDGTEDKDWRDATEAEYAGSATETEIYKDLIKRRKALDARQKEVERRFALLEAAEKEMDRKLRELTAIQQEIKDFMASQSQDEQARIDSLVKIYEGMKAKDAARIFNTLDTDVLLQVLTKMSERKTAPILAAMDPDRARAVTILMAQQRQIPGVSNNKR